MIDIDELERIANAGDPWGYAATAQNILELCAEMRRLRAEEEALKHDLASYMTIAAEYLTEIEAWRLVAKRKHEMVECDGDFDAAYEAWDVARAACKAYHDEAIAKEPK